VQGAAVGIPERRRPCFRVDLLCKLREAHKMEPQTSRGKAKPGSQPYPVFIIVTHREMSGLIFDLGY